MTDKARYLKKKKWQPEFWPDGPKSGQKLVFFSFLQFGALVFLDIAYNDSLQQCITCSRGKNHENIFGVQILHQTGQN